MLCKMIFTGSRPKQKRRLRWIFESEVKTDRVDAEALARVGRLDAKLLYPTGHRSQEVQAGSAVMCGREAVVKARAQLINNATLPPFPSSKD